MEVEATVRHAFKLDPAALTIRRLFVLRRRAGRLLRHLRGEPPDEREALLEQAGLIDELM